MRYAQGNKTRETSCFGKWKTNHYADKREGRTGPRERGWNQLNCMIALYFLDLLRGCFSITRKSGPDLTKQLITFTSSRCCLSPPLFRSLPSTKYFVHSILPPSLRVNEEMARETSRRYPYKSAPPIIRRLRNLAVCGRGGRQVGVASAGGGGGRHGDMTSD